jgi:hypothetical protein
MLPAMVLGDPYALNVGLKTGVSGQVETLLCGHRCANGTIEIQR